MNEYEVTALIKLVVKVEANNPDDAQEKALEELDMEYGFSNMFLDGDTTIEEVKEV